MGVTTVQQVTKQAWKDTVFPEWGTWLNEEIDGTAVEPGKVALWWLSNMGVWIKSDQQTSVVIDFWCGAGKTTHQKPEMPPRHQWARLTGGRAIQPNLRMQPMVIDPFEVRYLDAFLVTHFHSDHQDLFVTGAILQNVQDQIPLIGPKAVVEKWISWGVPRERCRVVKPGDVLYIKDVEITVTDSFDRTALISDAEGLPVADDRTVPNLDERAVNYVIKTSGGTIYHGADSHYSTYFAKHGQDFDIDIALLAFAENPVGIQDKMTSVDILRAAEALQTKVVIPLHWDIWSNMLGDPHEIAYLWQLRKERFAYRFHPFLWQPGGRFVFPDDREKLEYFHNRGFEDRYRYPINLPYTSFL